MAEAVVAIVIKQLGDLLIESIVQEAKSLHVVNDRVNKAKAELRRLRCFLKDADSRARGGDERVRNWVAEIREAAYDLEDAVLTALSSETIRREGRFGKVIKRLACLYREGVELHRDGSEIEEISNSISDLRASLQTCGVSQLESAGSDGHRQRELRRAYSHVVENDIVGLDENIEELVACLTRERNPDSRVVSICGMGGLGKTTLARKVYQHSQIRSHFDSVAWASISQQCQVGSVWKQVLGKVWPHGNDDIGESEACRKLYDILKERKCLIVLDDIWTTEAWDRLSPAFPKEETNSKILLTTRNKELALYADGNGIVHEPRCLDDKESWELFEKVFRGSPTDLEEENKKKKELGKEMLKHCSGLPLAIIVLRGILSRKQAVFEWEAIQKNAKMYINEGKVSELQSTSENSGVSWVLGLSYDDLPYQLKPCFMHLANFPEDHEIRVSDLCRIWLAEGFVSSEDTCYEFLQELVQRCMVLKGASSSTDRGRMKTCLVHDLMRDLCLSKSREENFLQFFNLGGRSQEDNKDCLAHKVRRLALIDLNKTQATDTDALLSIIRGGCIRSVICFELCLPSEILIPLFDWFHMLRVLKLEACSGAFIRFPNEIGELSHLRYLSLRDSKAHPFPSSISKLRYVQTLDLRVSTIDIVDTGLDFKLLKMVTNWSLVRLRHLYLPLPRWRNCNILVEKASNARTLVGIQTSYPRFSHLSQLTNLTKLALHFDNHWQGGVTFDNLRSLTVYTYQGLSIAAIISSCPRIHKLKVSGRVKELPEARQISPELVKLTLDGTCLENDPMPTLEKLPKLGFLCLSKSSKAGAFVCSKGGFPRLEFLHLCENSMEEWFVEEGAFPVLRRLTFYGFSKLRTFPDGLRNASTLEEIVFKGKKASVIRKLKEGGEDFHKVQHVPSLVFDTWGSEE